MLWDSYWHGDHAVDYQLLLNEHTGTHMAASCVFLGLPLKIKQGSGSPLRAIAVVPDDSR